MRILGIIFINNPPQWRYPVSSVTLWPLIRLVTRSKWNHCAILCKEEWGELVVIEALGSGVEKTGYDEWYLRAERKTDLVLRQRDGGILWLPLNSPYDFKGLLWYKLIKMITGRWYGLTGERAKQMVYCSELCALAVGYERWWDVSPEELYRYLKAPQPAKA